MDSKKIFAIGAAVVVAVAAIGIAIVVLNNNNGSENGELSVVYLKKNGYETEMVAEKKGFFGDFGLTVKGQTVTGSGQDAVNMLLAGSVDIAATGQGPVANTLHNYSDDLVIICGVNHSTGGQVIVAKIPGLVAYDKATDNKAAVKDSFAAVSSDGADPIKIGVQQGATTESELKGWLKAMGIPFNDFDKNDDGKYVKLVNYKANTLVSTLAAGTIDAMAASQPFPTQALEIDGVYQIGTNADVDSYDCSMYITTKKVYDEKKDLIEKFIKGLDKTSKYMADPANTAECKQIVNDVINDQGAVDGAFAIAQWKTAWTDDMANTLLKTCTKKGYTEVTLDTCKEKCPFRELLAGL